MLFGFGVSVFTASPAQPKPPPPGSRPPVLVALRQDRRLNGHGDWITHSLLNDRVVVKNRGCADLCAGQGWGSGVVLSVWSSEGEPGKESQGASAVADPQTRSSLCTLPWRVGPKLNAGNLVVVMGRGAGCDSSLGHAETRPPRKTCRFGVPSQQTNRRGFYQIGLTVPSFLDRGVRGGGAGFSTLRICVSRGFAAGRRSAQIIGVGTAAGRRLA